MNAVVGAFGRAILSQLHIRMLLLTLLPFIFTGVVWGAAMYLGWSFMTNFVDAMLLTSGARDWLDRGLSWVGFQSYTVYLAPFLIVVLLAPLIVVSALFATAIMAGPVSLRHVGSRRFPHLEQKRGGGFLGSLIWSLWSSVLFTIIFLLTLPLWLIPPFFALIPPVLWGWLTYRVMAYDTLAEHATSQERKIIFERHRGELLAMGIICGLLGSAPTLFWVASISFFVLFPFIAAGTLWIYVLIFVFSSLWFAHFCLAALDKLRKEEAANKAQSQPDTIDVVATIRDERPDTLLPGDANAAPNPAPSSTPGSGHPPSLPPDLPRTPFQ